MRRYLGFRQKGVLPRAVFVTVGLITLLVFSGCELWGGYQNPNDPKSDNYVGSAKSITSFAFVGFQATGIINESARTILITLPFGTNVSTLIATFTTTGKSVKVNGVAQISGNTQNDYTYPVQYLVTAADGTSQLYSVIVARSLNSAKSVTSFAFQSPVSNGVISESTHSILLSVPYSTNVTSLTPSIGISGVSISPDSGVPQNFANPVTYRVTAADGSSQDYTVTVTVALNTAKSITSFSFPSLSVAGVIDQSTHTVDVLVPYGTIVTYMSPSISISGSSISPGSSTPQNFTNPVTYTVTAADGTSQSYSVNVTVALNPAKYITSFSFESPSAVGVVNEASHTIAVTIAYGTSVTALTPTIGITGASVSPASGVAQNFTNPVTYTVTAADGTTQAYTVTVTIALNTAKSITSFSFASPSAIGSVNETDHTITVNLPHGTSVSALVPTIGITGASVSPASGVAQNFTSPVTYTVTAENQTSQEYIVYVSVALYADTNLASLLISSGVLIPMFDPNITEYNTTVEKNQTTVIVTATPEDTTCDVVVDPSQPTTLVIGETIIYITVVAQDQSTKRYSIIVQRIGDYVSPNIGTLKYVPSGMFQRDSESGNVTSVSQFRMGEKEITSTQFTSVTGISVPSVGINTPAYSLNFYHGLVFCNQLSLLESLTPYYKIANRIEPDYWISQTNGGIPLDSTNAVWDSVSVNWDANGYRLPTESEWMWAAMGASAGAGFSSGVYSVGYMKEYSGDLHPSTLGDSIDEFVWYTGNSSSSPKAIGTKLSNELGIYDMSGNVWEWCWDWYGLYPNGLISDYHGQSSGTFRILRGGSSDSPAENCSVALRNPIAPHWWINSNIGIRVVRE